MSKNMNKLEQTNLLDSTDKQGNKLLIKKALDDSNNNYNAIDEIYNKIDEIYNEIDAI